MNESKSKLPLAPGGGRAKNIYGLNESQQEFINMLLIENK
jgi:hypothetical protein